MDRERDRPCNVEMDEALDQALAAFSRDSFQI